MKDSIVLQINMEKSVTSSCLIVSKTSFKPRLGPESAEWPFSFANWGTERRQVIHDDLCPNVMLS